MKKKILSILTAVTMLAALTGCDINVNYGTGTANSAQPQVIYNSIFSIEMPADMNGTYETIVTDHSISFYDKESKEAGFGGFAFDVSAYKEPSEHMGGMDTKLGELTTKDGTLYDIVISYPSDVQFDYTNYEYNDMPANYARLYNGSENYAQTVKSVDGGEFVWGAGMHGEDLYGGVISKYVTAIKEGWDANKLEAEAMTPMVYALGEGEKNAEERLGFAYVDTNFDGVDELLIGEITEGEGKGTFYDIYTMVDRKPAHVISGWNRNSFMLLQAGSMICNNYSGGAAENGQRFFIVEPNSPEIIPQVAFKTDDYENPDQPYFISYDYDYESGEWINWENYPKTEYEERMSNFGDFNRLDFTPFSTVMTAE